MSEFYEDIEVTTTERILTNPILVKELIKRDFQEVLNKFGSPYEVTNVSLKSYPREILVTAVDRFDMEPDEDSLGLDDGGFDALLKLEDNLAKLTGASRVHFPYWYFSK